MYNIEATCTGGITGTRVALMKDSAGAPLVFLTENDAESYINDKLEPTRLRGGISPSGRILPTVYYNVIKTF